MQVEPKVYKVESLTIPVNFTLIRLLPNDLRELARAKNLPIFKYRGNYYIVDGNVVFTAGE